MKRPRLRFDGLPLWPAAALLAIGASLIAGAYTLTRAVELVDDAHLFLEGDDE